MTTPTPPEDGLFLEYKGYSLDLSTDTSGSLKLVIEHIEDAQQQEKYLTLRITKDLQLNWS